MTELVFHRDTGNRLQSKRYHKVLVKQPVLLEIKVKYEKHKKANVAQLCSSTRRKFLPT